MKKTKLVVLLLLLALVTGILFTGCTFVKENEERVANSVLSTISYEYKGNEYFPKQTLQLTITRSELMSYINYVIYLYSNYNMQYDPVDVFESSLDSLESQKYQILQAMEYLMDNATKERRQAMYYFTPEYKAVHGDKITAEGLLTIAERYSYIATTNESFISSIEQYVEDYNKETRELSITAVKEDIAAHYAAGFKIAEEDGVIFAKLNDDGEYQDGFYLSEVSADTEPQVDYKKVFFKLTMVKDGEEDFIAYLPVGEDSFATEEDEENKSSNPHITNKLIKSVYEEPYITTEEETDEKGKKTTKEVTAYKSHAVEASYKVINPRTSFSPADQENEEEDDESQEILNLYRYFTAFDNDDADQKEFVEKGQLFDIAPQGLDDATRDAYRRFREEKKNALIGFTQEKDPYNGLGHYYKSSFESAILDVLKHELKQEALRKDPIDDAKLQSQYAILAKKQKEEYDILSYKEQIDKFAKDINSDLSSCFYIPLEAMLNTTYTYTDSDGNEQTRTYATLNEDNTYTIDMFYITHVLFKFDDAIKTIIDRFVTKDLKDEDDIKAEKLRLILDVGLLNTNKSNENYNEESGDSLQEAYYVVLDTDGNPKLFDEDGNALTLEEQFLEEKVKTVYASLENDLAQADTYQEKLDVFKEYMTWYNDDGGSMKSKLGYFVAMGDIEHSYDGNDFPNAAKELYIDYIEDGKFDGGKPIRNAFTSYGLHIVMISFMPFNNVDLVDLEDGVWALGIDAKLDLEDASFRDDIESAVEEAVSSKAYSKWSSSTNKEAKENTVRAEKKINKLAKDLGIKRTK